MKDDSDSRSADERWRMTFAKLCRQVLEWLDLAPAISAERVDEAVARALEAAAREIQDLDFATWKIVVVRRAFLRVLAGDCAEDIAAAQEDGELFPRKQVAIAEEIRLLLTPQGGGGKSHAWFDPGSWRLGRADVDFIRWLRLDCLVTLMEAQEQAWRESGLDLATACRIVVEGGGTAVDLAEA